MTVVSVSILRVMAGGCRYNANTFFINPPDYKNKKAG
jgi:hypothetical protein